MCQAIVGKIIKITGKIAEVNINGMVRKINIEFVNTRKGDYVICAGGVAVEKVDESEAEQIHGAS